MNIGITTFNGNFLPQNHFQIRYFLLEILTEVSQYGQWSPLVKTQIHPYFFSYDISHESIRKTILFPVKLNLEIFYWDYGADVCLQDDPKSKNIHPSHNINE